MDIAELHKAVRSSFDTVFAKHTVLMEEAEAAVFRLNHHKGTKSLEFKTLPSRQLLDCAEDDLRDAQDRYRDALAACRDGTADNRPQRALPAEIIQYIVSLAYDNETLETYQGKPDRTGARSLAPTLTAYPRTHNFLLSSTTLQVDFYKIDFSELPSVKKVEHLEQTLPLKLEVILGDISVERTVEGNQFLLVILQHPSRMKSLTLCHCRDLNCFVPALPYIEHLSFSFNDRFIGSPNWTKIDELLQGSAPPKLRSLTLPSCVLAGFTSSGLLGGIVSLCIYDGVDRDDYGDQWPPLDQCLAILSKLQKLTSLELGGTGGRKLYNASDDKCYGFASLKRLQLTCYGWKYASHLVFRFSRCDLREILFKKVLFWDALGPFDIDVFACTLSDTFPRLSKLKIPTTEGYKLLHRGHGDSDNAWNFPLLHTLDICHTRCSSEDAFRLIDVLRDRAGPEAHTLGVVPINCLFLYRLRVRDEDRKLAEYALMQLVPNVVCVLPDVTMKYYGMNWE